MINFLYALSTVFAAIGRAVIYAVLLCIGLIREHRSHDSGGWKHRLAARK